MIRKFRTMALAASSILMMGAAAQAADLYTPMPEPVPAYTGGWYFSAFGGANWLDDTSFEITQAVTNQYDPGFVVGGAIGYDFGQAMGPLGARLEAEVSYRNNTIDSHTIGAGAPLTGSDALGETSALAGMANLLFDINSGGPLSFYGGGGVGVANVDFDGHGTAGSGVVMDDDETVFAWQAIAGVGFEISQSIVLDVQYRYFNAAGVSLTDITGIFNSSTDYQSHAVLGGIRFKF